MLSLTLHPAKLIKRYKRFLADVTLPTGEVTTIHCANTGAMTGCGSEGDTLYYSVSDNAKRKYPFSWELTQTAQGELICINTQRANQLVEQALKQQAIKELQLYDQWQREVKYGEEGSKVDFLLTHSATGQVCYLEVKSCTLLQQNMGYFPDAVTTRGQKHLRELIHLQQQGVQTALLFAVMHSGIKQVQAAAHIDAEYAKLLSQAIACGVKVLAYGCQFTQTEQQFYLSLAEKLPVIS